LPLVSNIIPIKQALGNSLRNALDQFRSGADEFEVKMIRLKNFGLSINQFILAFSLLGCGILTYFYVPQAFLSNDIRHFSYLINLLLVVLIIGMILIAQAFIAPLEKMFLSLFIFLKPSDYKMKPIVLKNLRSHGNRNMKTSLMFTVTLSFLVFSSANFRQIHFFLVSFAECMSGSDLTAAKLNIYNERDSVIDEFKIREFLEENLSKRGGLVENYSFQSVKLEDTYNTNGLNGHAGRHEIFHGGTSKGYRLKVQAVERNFLDSTDAKYFYPGEYLNDPYNTGKNYQPMEIFDMMYDIEDQSNFE
jgi:hypothetical protein